MNKKIAFAFVVLFFTIISFTQAQYLIKAGPSVLYNYSDFDSDVYTNYGGQVSFEFAVKTNKSIHLSLLAHYGTHPNVFDDNLIQKDLLIGFSPEYRFHFEERFNGIYLGLGFDLKYLIAKNFSPPTPSDPEPTLVNTEFNVGISVGEHFILKSKNVINIFLYLGMNPSSQNEFEINSRIGLAIGLYKQMNEE